MKCTCQKCHKTLDQANFYTYKTGQKVEMCKSCMTMHIDNFDPDTYLWILEKMDVPYVPEEWKLILDKAYAKNPKKVNGMSVLGKYLALMRLRQYKNYTWADTEQLQEERRAAAQAKAEAARAQEEYVREQYEKGNITQAQYRTIVSTDYQHEHEYIFSEQEEKEDPVGKDNMFNENEFLSEEEMPDFNIDLSLQEKQYLVMKWGRTYKVSEWIELEKKYKEMMDSFDIQDADSKNALLLYCKTYLKMNQALDCGDIEGYQKLSRVLDTIRKSMKVTAAQKKEEKADFIDSVGQLVAYCQKNGGQIPRYEINTPYDIVDKIIDDLKAYNKTLIYEDTALARQIQDYIKEARAAAARKRDRAQAKAKGLDAPELSDNDVIAFKEFVQNEKAADAKIDEEVAQNDTE